LFDSSADYAIGDYKIWSYAHRFIPNGLEVASLDKITYRRDSRTPTEILKTRSRAKVVQGAGLSLWSVSFQAGVESVD
jgi:hypothetical protein